jgi:hypothetical protein
MTRKQFLQTVTVGIAASYGMSTIIKILHFRNIINQQPGDYSYSNYGGGADSGDLGGKNLRT